MLTARICNKGAFFVNYERALTAKVHPAARDAIKFIEFNKPILLASFFFFYYFLFEIDLLDDIICSFSDPSKVLQISLPLSTVLLKWRISSPGLTLHLTRQEIFRLVSTIPNNQVGVKWSPQLYRLNINEADLGRTIIRITRSRFQVMTSFDSH